MLSEAKSVQSWDLADPKTMRSNFSSVSFYIVVSGLEHRAVQGTAKTIKATLLRSAGVQVRGPLALPTERRRHVILREVRGSQAANGMYCSKAKRVRNVLLVMSPTADAIASLVSLPLAATVNVKVEPYDGQYDLKEPQQ
ncbi:30S ribosomal protein S10 [Pseudomonas guariconensis]|uniref:30S ribosomal protein S10 n=1 Tax=Pseudomonas guariconensis TaxID=1288410 RepID=UPI003906C1CA